MLLTSFTLSKNDSDVLEIYTGYKVPITVYFWNSNCVEHSFISEKYACWMAGGIEGAQSQEKSTGPSYTFDDLLVKHYFLIFTKCVSTEQKMITTGE